MAGPDTARAPHVDARASDAQLARLARTGAAPWLHGEVARRMAERLQVIRCRPQTVVDWSAALGMSAKVLADAYPGARRIAVEAHPALRARALREARRPWWSPARWRDVAPDVLDPGQLAPGGAQLLWANMALHFAADPEALMRQWQRALAVDGFLMFSTFGPDTLRELRAVHADRGWPPPAQDFVDMHDIGDQLVHAGFADPVMDQEHLTLTWSGAGEALRELRALGGNLHPMRHRGLRSPRWRSALETALAATADAQGRIALTFEIVYGHAFKAAPRARVAAETNVPLDDLRAMVRRARGA